MKLKDCKIGTIVVDRRDFIIGHIVGLSMNSTNEVIPVVKFIYNREIDDRDITIMEWDSVNDIKGRILAIHPSNIELLP